MIESAHIIVSYVPNTMPDNNFRHESNFLLTLRCSQRIGDSDTYLNIYVSVYLSIDWSTYLPILLYCLGLDWQQNWEEGIKMSHISSALTRAKSLPLSTSSTRAVYLLQLMNLHGVHPQSIVCIKVHSWFCTFYWFGQMYPPL